MPPPAPHTGSEAIVLIGGGGHALVVAETAHRLAIAIAGFLDDDPEARLGRIPLHTDHPPPPRLGDLHDLDAIGTQRWILATGDLTHRRDIHQAARRADLNRRAAVPLIHPDASLAPSATIEPGVWIGPGAVVHTLAHIQPHAIINSGAVLDHETQIGENAHIAPNATLGGNVRIGPHTLIGAGATVLPGIRIGEGCTIGAGAVVRADIPDHATAVGVPARII